VTGGDDDATMQEQQHAGWRSTYMEHALHVRHRAHVPITDGLIEVPGILQHSEGRMAAWSEAAIAERGDRGWVTTTTTQTKLEQQHAGCRGTYREHAIHGRHRAHVPSTDGLIEGTGTLQRSEGRTAVWSERRSRGDGTGAADDTATEEQQQHAGWCNTYIEHPSHVRH